MSEIWVVEDRDGSDAPWVLWWSTAARTKDDALTKYRIDEGVDAGDLQHYMGGLVRVVKYVREEP